MADDSAPRGQKRSNMEFARLLGALAAGGLLAAFAVLNTDEVEVNWVFGTLQTPLIVVILVCLAVGIMIGLLGGGVRSRAKAKRSAARS
jgi:uncharacterized integral membrane protein